MRLAKQRPGPFAAARPRGNTAAMKAAVVHDFDAPPAYREFANPSPKGDEVLVTVHAAALSNLVKGQAAGTHYSAPKSVPFVPGVDGVGRLPGGERVYFAFPKAPYGAMAEQTVVPRTFCTAVPDEVDDVTAAAAANPGMSSWAALERAGFEAGQSVLINGATGAAGRLAIQIAKHLGARRVVATGRNLAAREAMLSLGADAFIPLDPPRDAVVRSFQESLAAGIDVVLDYLWGASAEQILEAIASGGHENAAHRIRFVQIGAMAANAITLPAMTLRSHGVELLGSGIGSVPNERLVQLIGSFLKAVVPARMAIEAEAVPLTSVPDAWNRVTSKRLVFTL
jgi:NADPH:quinone reductase-like Zn-dependent oxidoreductase